VATQPAGEVAPSIAERALDAGERVRALRANHGAVRVLPSPTGEVVWSRVDGGAARAAGYTLYLTPGRHALELYSGTPRARTDPLEIVAGSIIEVRTEREPSPIGSLDLGEPPPRPFPTGWVIGGAAATALAGGITGLLAVNAANKRDDAEALGVGHTQYAAARNEFEDARSTYRASFIGPAAFAAATLGLVLIWNLSQPAPRTQSGAR
jgi:hypothetical protein